MRLIDADKLILELATNRNYHATNCREENLLSKDIIIVNEQPAIKAIEVIRHAHWVNNVDDYVELDMFGHPEHSAFCSNCGAWLTGSDEYDCKGYYCPNCGAKMDEKI